jgi:hypothetical protein
MTYLQELALQSGLDLNVERHMPRPLRAKKLLGINLDAAVYAFETSTIDLCLSLHPGHRFAPPRQPSNCRPLLTWAAAMA